VRIKVTMYFKPFAGMTDKQKKMEGGPTDPMRKPLCSLEDYLKGEAAYVSLARDYLGGPPGGDARFRKYGTKVRIREVEALVGRANIEFRLVDTGGHFYGRGKVVKVKGAEPIDLCRSKPLQHPRTEGLMTLEFVEGG
jgi:hypothetical protein